MIVTHKITMDLVKGGTVPWINAVQNDKYGHNVEISLYADGDEWIVPSGVCAVVHYLKADGTGGSYDTLPDGSPACTGAGNVLTVALAPQVCTANGITQLAVSMMEGDAEINTATIIVNVQQNPKESFESEDYYRLSGLLPRSGWAPNMYLGTDAYGNVVMKSAPSGGSNGAESPEVTIHGIIWDLVNVTASNSATSVIDGTSLSAVLTPADGYTLGDVTVTMGGEVLTGAWDAGNATVTIVSVTGDVIISCAGVEIVIVDTSPVIAETGKCYRSISTSSPNVTLTSHVNYCITKIYEFTPDVAAIEAHPSYNTDAGYINASGGMAAIRHFVPNAKCLANGGTDTNATYKKAAFFVDGVLQTNIYGNLTSQSTSGGFNVYDKDVRQKTINGVSFTLYQADVEDSYAYWTKDVWPNAVLPLGINDGDIIFAGKNTEYYGMKNIYGSASGTEVSIAEEVDNAVMMLAMPTGENAVASDYSNLDANYVSMVQANYDAMMAECLGDYTKIPLIVHTDQHGKLSNAKGKDILRLIGTVTNWYEIGKCINLGDTCGDTFTESTLQSYLENMADYIPLSKRVEVYGNHDIWDEDEAQKYTVNQKRVSPYFKNIYARRHGNNGYFTVADDYYNVKYLVLNCMEYPDTNTRTHRITTAQAKFIVSELSAKDGYDVVVLSHVALDAVGLTLRDGTVTGDGDLFVTDATVRASFRAMLTARKAKTGGTFTDSEGVSHTYDFANVDSDILLSLHGHHHIEGYKKMSSGITEFVFDCMKDHDALFYFCYIDRENKKFKYWRNEANAEAREISLA